MELRCVEMEVLLSGSPGLVVGKALLCGVAACSARRDPSKTATGSVRLMRGWLGQERVTIAVMESRSTAAHMKGRRPTAAMRNGSRNRSSTGCLRALVRTVPGDSAGCGWLTLAPDPADGGPEGECIRLVLMLDDREHQGVVGSLHPDDGLGPRMILAATIAGEREDDVADAGVFLLSIL